MQWREREEAQTVLLNHLVSAVMEELRILSNAMMETPRTETGKIMSFKVNWNLVVTVIVKLSLAGIAILASTPAGAMKFAAMDSTSATTNVMMATKSMVMAATATARSKKDGSVLGAPSTLLIPALTSAVMEKW
jgi:hypothetical protein